jgi:hypothetical protein
MGKPKTEEHRRKISEALRGRKHTERSRQLRSEAMLRFWSKVQTLKPETEKGAQGGDD